jgi:ATP-dependent protease ClpP protease subunit
MRLTFCWKIADTPCKRNRASSNTGKTVEEVNLAMLERTTLSPDEAKGWGLAPELI